MLTIETEATVAEGKLVINAPADLRAGSYRVVVVVEYTPVDDGTDADAWEEFLALADDPEVQRPLDRDSADIISEMRR